MPLLSIFRFFSTLLSWAVLAGAVWLLWEWYQGDVFRSENGDVAILRADWLLWMGVALTAWSFLGKFFWRLVLARPDVDAAKPERAEGTLIAGADGSQLLVESSGNEAGLPFILTHGAGMDSTIWYLTKEALGSKYRIITWDLPGLGRSKASKIDLDHYAANLQVVLRFVNQPAVLVGHSMGGMIIQTLAMRQPQLFGTAVIGVVLLNTTYTNPLTTMILSRLARALQPLLKLAFHVEIVLFPLAWLSAWQSYLSGSTHIANRLTFGKGVTRTQLDHVSLLGTRNSPASIARGNLAMIDWDATGAIANISDPVHIVAGDGDIVTKPEASERIARAAVAPSLSVISNANHMSFLDHATRYHELIDRAATEARQRARATAAS